MTTQGKLLVYSCNEHITGPHSLHAMDRRGLLLRMTQATTERFDMLHRVSGTSFLLHSVNLIPYLTLLFLFLLPSFQLLLMHLFFHHP